MLSGTISGGLTAGNLGLQNFRAVMGHSSSALSSMRTSFGRSLVAALVAAVLGIAIAYVTTRGPRTRRRGLIPLVVPSVLASMRLVFTVAARELEASLLVEPVGTDTINTYIWRQFDQGSIGESLPHDHRDDARAACDSLGAARRRALGISDNQTLDA